MTQAGAVSDMVIRPIRKFNPGTFQSDGEVIGQFVVRNRELGIVLEVLRGNIDSPSCQHTLVVAPRGRGKTMLLARVAAELRTDDILSGQLLPVRFMEESQEIFNLADFWLETLFHLAREIAPKNPEFARGMRETHAALSDRWRDQALEEQAQAAVLEAAERLDRKLVLMVENLQLLGENVDEDFGWKLRGVLQSAPQIMLLATATSRFEGLDDAEQPFFELFRIVGLEPLTTKECRRLWRVVSSDIVSDYQIRPLQILTGGSPRLLVIVAGFARHRSLRQLMEELVKLVDEHTEYFRGHLEVLAKNERRVYVSVIDLWQPSKPGEIAARARMDIRVVSTMLGRLVDRGVVIVEGSGRKRLYAASERLYCIYYKLRRERDEAAVVRNLIHFMTVFYRSDELAEMTIRWRVEAAQSEAIREGLESVLDASDRIDMQMEVAKELLNRGVTHRKRDESESALATYDDLVDRFGDSGILEIQVQVAKALYNKGVTHHERGEFKAALAACDDLVARFRGSDAPEIQIQVAKALFCKVATHRKRDESEAVLATCNNLVERFGGSKTQQIQMRVSMSLLIKVTTHYERDEFESVLAACDDLVERFGGNDTPKIQVQVAMVLFFKGATHHEREEFEAALAAYDDLVERFGDSDIPEIQVQVANALLNKSAMHRKRDESESALATYDDLVARFGGSDTPEIQVQVARALLNKGVTHHKRDESDAALAAYDDLVARFCGSDAPEIQVQVAKALLNKGVKHGQIGESEAAMIVCSDLVARFGGSDTPEIQVQVVISLLYKVLTHAQRDEYEAALAACDDLVARFCGSDAPEIQEQVATALVYKALMHDECDEYEAALAVCDDLVARFGGNDAPEIQVQVAKALLNKGVTHGQRDESELALAAYDDLIARFGGSDTLEIQVQVATALLFKGDRQIEIGRADKALCALDEFDRRCGVIIDYEPGEGAFLLWQAKWIRTHALLVQKEHFAALRLFQTVCGMFVVGDERMLREMLMRVPILVSAGASERDLVKILSANSKTADALTPLVVALRGLSGESVRAPAEVLEVAADVRKHIETGKQRGAGIGARRDGC